MGFLTRMIASPESLESDAAERLGDLRREWEAYVASVAEKESIVKGQWFNTERLLKLLRLELVDLERLEYDDKQILDDLESVEHDKRILRVHRLLYAFSEAEQPYHYILELFSTLHQTLKMEYHLLQKLHRGDHPARERLITHVKNQIELERTVIGKIRSYSDGPTGFDVLERWLARVARGEHKMTLIGERQAVFKRRMHDLMFQYALPDSITYRWIDFVVERLKDKDLEDEASDFFADGGQHNELDIQFVNSERFRRVVEDAIMTLRPKQVSERMIDAFVRAFRVWYNEINLYR